ncbi:MAG: DNA methyltransferase [Nocardioidaceae bacterium]
MRHHQPALLRAARLRRGRPDRGRGDTSTSGSRDCSTSPGELARVLKPSGALWLNLGDGYSRHSREGTAKKSLLLGPERVALALTDDGWLLRNKVIWAKTNPMPASVGDRLSCGHEVIYFFTRAAALLLRPHTPSGSRR